MNTETILKRILEIIHFDGDRDEFAKEFINLCKTKAAIALYGKNQPINEEELLSTISRDPEHYLAILEKETEKLFKSYFEHIYPGLTTEEKKELLAYLDETLGT